MAGGSENRGRGWKWGESCKEGQLWRLARTTMGWGVGYAVFNRKDLFRAGRLGSRGVAEERITGTILITNELRNFRSRDAQVRGQECPSHTLSISIDGMTRE